MNYPRLTPSELVSTAETLYGQRWRSALAEAFEVSEAEIVMVESGRTIAPPQWRAKLIALAQELALRSLEAANNLIWRESADEQASAPQYATPRYA